MCSSVSALPRSSWPPTGSRPLAGGGQNFLQSIELKTYDWRLTHTARPSTARQDIALVEIDEYSLRNLEPNAGRWPWPRVVHSMLIDYLARAPAKVIVYDVDFAERTRGLASRSAARRGPARSPTRRSPTR